MGGAGRGGWASAERGKGGLNDIFGCRGVTERVREKAGESRTRTRRAWEVVLLETCSHKLSCAKVHAPLHQARLGPSDQSASVISPKHAPRTRVKTGHEALSRRQTERVSLIRIAGRKPSD